VHGGDRTDPRANAARRPDVDVAAKPSLARILISASREELTLVGRLQRLVHTPGGDR